MGTKIDVPQSILGLKELVIDLPQSFIGGKEPTMDVPISSTKRGEMDVDSFALAHAPLPPPLATSRPKMRTSARATQAAQARELVKPLTSIRIRLNKDGSFPRHQCKFEKGNTALAFTFEEGIIVAVDHSSKSSVSPKNVFELNSHMLATISGGCEFLLEELQKEVLISLARVMGPSTGVNGLSSSTRSCSSISRCYRQEHSEGRKTSIAEALKWLAKILAGVKGKLPIGILIAVWNESDRGLYHMNGKGRVVSGYLFATGCGSAASSIVQAKYAPCSYPQSDDQQCRYASRFRLNIPVTKAADLAKRAICVAAHSAPYSGDTVSVFCLGTDGCEKLVEDNIEEWQKANIKLPRIRFEVIGKGWSEAEP